MVATTLPAVVRVVDLPTGTTVTGGELVEAIQTVSGVQVSVQLSLNQVFTSIGGVPTGGATGTILNKSSGSNYSTQFSAINTFVNVGTSLATTGSATSIVVFVANQGITSTQIANNAVGTNQVASSLGIASSLSIGTLLTVGGTATITGTTILNGGLKVTGTSLLTGTFGVVGTSLLTGAFNVTGTSVVTGSLAVSGPIENNRNISAPASVGSGIDAIHVTAATANAAAFVGDSFATNSFFLLRRADGTAGTPTPVAAGSRIGTISFSPYDGSAFASGARINGLALNTQSTTDHSGFLTFSVVGTGSTGIVEAMRIQASGGVSIGTTSDSGIGSLNTTGNHAILSGTPLSSTATATLLFGSISSFGIYVGTGVPGVSAGTGSIFLRNDGATATSRMYVNINGTGTWTAFNTVA